jgi:hypothetical protein
MISIFHGDEREDRSYRSRCSNRGSNGKGKEFHGGVFLCRALGVDDVVVSQGQSKASVYMGAFKGLGLFGTTTRSSYFHPLLVILSLLQLKAVNPVQPIHPAHPVKSLHPLGDAR